MLGHFKKIYGGQPEMAVRRVLFCRQHNGKFRTLARLRNHFDIAALPRYDLAGQIQANAHALLFPAVNFFEMSERCNISPRFSMKFFGRCNISRTFGFYNSLINKSEEATQWN